MEINLNLDITEVKNLNDINICLNYSVDNSLPIKGSYAEIIKKDENNAIAKIYCIKPNKLMFYYGYLVFENCKVYTADGDMIDYDDNLQSYVDIPEENTDIKYKIVGYSPELSSKLEWIDNSKAVLKYELIDYLSLYYNFASFNPGWVVINEKLDSNFSISEKYENDPKWLIVNENELIEKEISEEQLGYIDFSFDDKDAIPKKIYTNFFKWENVHDGLINEGIKYIYIKDKNILYFLLSVDDEKTSVRDSIELVYVGNNYLENSIYNFNTKSNFLCGRYTSSYIHYIDIRNILGQKQIRKESEEKTKVTVNKLVNGEKGDKIYYVGLFNNENDRVTDNIYEIITVDGIGSVEVEIPKYLDIKEYYVYEVDENGNKITNDKLVYSKNKVLENIVAKEEYEINTDKNIISAVEMTSSEEGGKESGEDEYVANNLIKTNIYEDTVTITSEYEEPVHIVKYESEKGGILEGETNEIVRGGESPQNIPIVKANENYVFDKWVVVKNGEEIEVVPSEYVVLEDTTFIAKYKKIEKVVVEENIPALPDTSDINIWKYVGIAAISILVIIIVVIILVISKNNRGKSDI